MARRGRGKQIDELALEHGIVERASLRLLQGASERIERFQLAPVLELAAAIMDYDDTGNVSELAAVAEAIQYTTYRTDPSDPTSVLRARTLQETVAIHAGLDGPLKQRGEALLALLESRTTAGAGR